jgi:hypothetical protein
MPSGGSRVAARSQTRRGTACVAGVMSPRFAQNQSSRKIGLGSKSDLIRLHGSYRIRPMSDFEVLVALMAILPYGLVAVPWFFGKRWRLKGIWLGAGLVAVILCLLPLLFDFTCAAYACGQAVFAIFLLGPIWLLVAVMTIVSAVIAYYKFAR